MTEADDIRAWKRKQLGMNANPPKLPEGVHVSDRVQDLFDNLAAQADVLPPGEDRLDVLEAMAGIRDRVKSEANADPGFIENPFNDKTMRNLGDGRYAVEEVDPRGNVRTTPNAILRDGQVVEIDPEQLVEAEKTQRRWIDEIAAARQEQQDAGRLGRLAGELDDDSLREQAATRKASADQRLQAMRDEIPHEMWQSFELGRFDPVKAAIAPVVEALQDGKLDDALQMFSNMTIGERYHFMQEVGDLPGGMAAYEELVRRAEGES